MSYIIDEISSLAKKIHPDWSASIDNFKKRDLEDKILEICKKEVKFIIIKNNLKAGGRMNADQLWKVTQKAEYPFIGDYPKIRNNMTFPNVVNVLTALCISGEVKKIEEQSPDGYIWTYFELENHAKINISKEEKEWFSLIESAEKYEPPKEPVAVKKSQRRIDLEDEIALERANEFQRRLDDMNSAILQSKGWIKGVICPACRKETVQKISSFKRAGSIALFGLFSSNVGKSMECFSCGYKF